ncbi:hypothetical protein DM02DRAFT_640156 [Periconia macrospinosa]|uniref:Uncharacterized protein n=1 Tax=Periconia macrospinosa TaxID=97972 RepID=A0A2V1E0M5_9PLEO|nr:hypothetical protein DM02DRAFT_640156 [Periconia macrospinosa]
MLDFVLRRGLEHAGGVHVLKRSLTRDNHEGDFPVWGVLLLAFTAVAFLIFILVVSYVLEDLIATLAMTETPGTAITVSAPKEAATGEEKEGLLEASPETTLVHKKPITSSIRGTLKHLRTQHGRRAYLKGFGYFMLFAFAHSWVANILFLVVPRNLFFSLVVSAAAGAICAPLHAAWTNKVLSKHSDMTFMQRIPSRGTWKVIALPAAIYAVIPYLEGFALVAIASTFRNSNNPVLGFLQWTAAFFVIVASTIFIVIPVMATLVRTEASVISEDQDIIIPFDRTFAGKFVPASLGGTGAIGFMDAWRSFEGRRRVFWLFVKSFFIMFFIMFFMFLVIGLEFFAILGNSAGPKVRQALGHPN